MLLPFFAATTANAQSVANVEQLRAAASATGSGNIVLTGDITITDAVRGITTDATTNAGLFIGRDLTLDLAGHSLTITIPATVFEANGIKIGTGFTLTIMDSSPDAEGTLTVTYSGLTTGFLGFSAAINTSDGTLIIESGTVNATGGITGAGIGGGWRGNGGTTTISGGTVNATGGNNGAGIGGGANGVLGGTITISGGTVNATGGSGGAGIGGGGGNIFGGNITISDGKVNATGGTGAAGIGGGSVGSGGTTTISGGTVTAIGGSDGDGNGGAGIGGGAGRIIVEVGVNIAGGNSGTITISGGTIEAQGGVNAAGIGGGSDGNGEIIEISGGTVNASGGIGGAGIGGGVGVYTEPHLGNFILRGGGGNITINGGTVTATGGTNAADIGVGSNSHETFPIGAPGTLTLNNNIVLNVSRITNNRGDVLQAISGNGTLIVGDNNIRAGASLTIRQGVTLTNNGALTNNGTITNSGTITNNGTFTNNGAINCSTGEIIGTLGGARANFTGTVNFPTGLTATFGQTLADVALGASTTPPGNFAWTLPTTTSVGNAGLQTHSVTFTLTSNVANYNARIEDVVVNVAKAAAPVITWPTSTAITYGAALSTSALSPASNAYGSFAWTDGTIIPTVTNSGYSVTFTPSADTIANYEPIATTTANVAITVNKAAAPAITFPTSTAITYGAALSTSALSPASNAYGSFAWTDGTIIPTVTNSGYSVTFTPSADTIANYEPITTTTANVAITVNKAAAPAITWPTSATPITYGQTLADATLNPASDANGSFAWTDGTIAPTVAQSGNGFGVRYTPNDTVNYDYTGVTLTANMAVTVNRAAYTPTTYTLFVFPEGEAVSYTLPRPAPGASYNLASGTASDNTSGLIDNGGAWALGVGTRVLTFATTAQTDGTTAEITVPVTAGDNHLAYDLVVTVLASVAAQDNRDIAAAKAAIEGAFPVNVAQRLIADEAAALAEINRIINALPLNGVTPAVTKVVYTAAQAGTQSTPAGTNGIYTFTVALNKGGGTEQTTVTLALNITATAFQMGGATESIPVMGPVGLGLLVLMLGGMLVRMRRRV